MAATPSNVVLWTFRRIPYQYENGFPYVDEVEDAMRKWSEEADVWFVERSGEADYILIKQAASSNSAIGMQFGQQIVNISHGYKALHELGHTLGLIHEQSRGDRDAFVDIQWNHIQNGQNNYNFQLYTQSGNLTPYDKGSVMHYPAPATGWGGYPQGSEVWTMRWKADRDAKLGGGVAQGWTNLSETDKMAIRILYKDVPVPVGPQTDHNAWKEAFQTQCPFTVGGRTFFFAQNMDNGNWFIREIMPGGEMGGETDYGTWKFTNEVAFSFTIGGKVYLYGQDMDTRYWFIRELLPNGKMGDVTASNPWMVPYRTQVTYTIGGRVFIFGQYLDTKSWFIQEVLPGGKMGRETDHGGWKFAYEVMFTYTVGSKVYLFGQNLNERNWFIQELKADGTLGAETAAAVWDEAYQVQFAYNINGHQYCYGQNLDTNDWFIRQLNTDGTMGEKLQQGRWKYAYGAQFPFQMGGRQYFYGQNLGGLNWFIQELIDVF